MKCTELCERYGIDRTEFDYYIACGIISPVRAEEISNDTDIQNLATIVLLREAGMNKEEIAGYMLAAENKNYRKQIHILRKQREILLGTVRDKGHVLDKLDYILYGLEHKS